jgi:hypothetical protein
VRADRAEVHDFRSFEWNLQRRPSFEYELRRVAPVSSMVNGRADAGN